MLLWGVLFVFFSLSPTSLLLVGPGLLKLAGANVASEQPREMLQCPLWQRNFIIIIIIIAFSKGKEEGWKKSQRGQYQFKYPSASAWAAGGRSGGPQSPAASPHLVVVQPAPFLCGMPRTCGSGQGRWPQGSPEPLLPPPSEQVTEGLGVFFAV